jgi:predicted nucleic acid-binding Zn ribbon protein
VRRLEPRPLGPALDAVAKGVAPATTLAAVQRHWADVAGARVAAEATPVRAHGGEVVVACRSAVWASELTLLADDLAGRLNDVLERPEGQRPVRRLRFQTSSGADGP